MLRILWLIIALSLFSLSGGAAQTISGKARVIDGDSLSVGGHEIRIFGIDAPEWGQACRLKDGGDFYPGKQATRWLKAYIGKRKLLCDVEETDRYRRKIAICYIGEEDIGRRLVREGLAFVNEYFSEDYGDYMAIQNSARAAGKGIWRGHCELPYIYRRKNPQ